MATDGIFSLIKKEEKRQREYLGLIPSENITSPAVREAVGSVLMHKYAEGQVKKRYYQGNLIVDEVEGECKRRAMDLFGLSETEWGVNVQALSGSPANLAVYNALLEPGDKIMSMFLPDGGHLSHGWAMADKKISFVSKIWKVEFYHVDQDTKVFDYDKIEEQARIFRPKLLISGGTAYPREIDHQRMGEIAKAVGAYYMADIAHEAGLVAAGVNTSPFPYADVVTMTTHKTLRGPRGAMIFARKALIEAINFSVFPGLQGGPHLHTIGGIAVALGEAGKPSFRQYAAQVIVNARLLAKFLVDAGYDVVSGGTDKHLVLVDLRSKNLSGWVVAWALEYAGIIANRNTVPFETASPFYPSGLRLGTPLLTTRGMKEKEMHQIGKWLVSVMKHCEQWPLPADPKERIVFTKQFRKILAKDSFLKKMRAEVTAFAKKFPLFSESV